MALTVDTIRNFGGVGNITLDQQKTGNSKADDVASCPFKRQDLRDGAFNILRVGVGHGLDQDGIPVPDLSVSDSDFSRFHCKRFPLIRLEMSLYVRNTIRPIRRMNPIM